MTLSFGKVFFARNKTGIKLGFTKLEKINESIKRLDNSHIPEKFTLCNYILVNNPKSVKFQISREIMHKKIHRDLYDITDYTIERLCDKYRILGENLNLDMNSDYTQYKKYFDGMIYVYNTQNK